MANPIRYFKFEDLNQIQHWLSLRGLPHMPQGYLPASGFIVDGVAVGFVLFTNSAIGILDYFISNPEVEFSERSEAISKITESLLILAKTSGCKAIKCETQSLSIELKAKHFGFKETGLFKSFFKEF